MNKTILFSCLALLALSGCYESSSVSYGTPPVINSPRNVQHTVMYGGRAVAELTIIYSNPGYSSNVYLSVKNISGQKMDIGFQLQIRGSNGSNFNFTTISDIQALPKNSTYNFGQVNVSPVLMTNPTYSTFNVSVAYIAGA